MKKVKKLNSKVNKNKSEDTKVKKNKSEDTKSDTTKSYTYGQKLSKFSLKYWQEYFKRETKPNRILLIIMQLRNGTIDQFTVAPQKESFNYNGAEYIINTSASRRDNHTNWNTLFYHQDISIPLNISVNPDEIKSMVEDMESDVVDVDKSINPFSLRRFITAEVIQQAIKGQELSADLKFMKMMLLINTIGLAIILFVLMQSSGIMSSMGI